MITIHWFCLYAIVAWTWALTCWSYESIEGKHHMSVMDSIGAVISAPLYFWAALLLIVVELIADAMRKRA